PDATDVAGQAIGILRHDLHGIAAVGLIDPHGPGGADAMAVQENHDLADCLLLGPGDRDACGSYRTNAVYLAQAIRCRLDDIEHLLAKGAPKLLGIDRANAADHARGEALLDALDRSGRRGLEEAGLELLTVSAVIDPVAGRGHPFAGRDRGGMAHQGDQFAVATGPNPQDAKAILSVLVRDALDHSGEHLAIHWRGLVLHSRRHTLGSGDGGRPRGLLRGSWPSPHCQLGVECPRAHLRRSRPSLTCRRTRMES